MPPLSPAVSLAMQMHSQPGQFAVLLGSGVSRGAQIPTGWGVVMDLVRRAAIAQAVAAGDPAPSLDTDEDVETWWARHGDGDLGYSQVLGAVADGPAGRQALLEKYFAPTTDGELRPPSAAHTALAKMVATGTVRVIITTNFDRLMEQALAAQGIDPQVISRPEAVKGMQPLAHAPATVIKLHGDYKDLTTLNTTGELATYPPEWTTLLARIEDEYGLLISGWSADWDVALVRALESRQSRRYPLFWDSRSSAGETARRLLAQHSGQVITSPDADTLFTDLAASVGALETLAEPPITTAIAVARVRQYLPNPLHRIDLHDLVLSRLAPIRAVADHYGSASTTDDYLDVLAAYQRASIPLLELLVTGARFDDGTHQKLWGEVLDRLLALHRRPAGMVWNDVMRSCLLYPALLAFYAMSAADVAAHHGSLMLHLGLDHTYEERRNRTTAVAELLRADLLLTGMADDTSAFRYPTSHQLRAHLADVLGGVSPEPLTDLLDDVEFRHALILAATDDPSRYSYPFVGEFRGLSQFSSEAREQLQTLANRMQRDADRAGRSWPWYRLVSDDITEEDFPDIASWATALMDAYDGRQ